MCIPSLYHMSTLSSVKSHRRQLCCARNRSPYQTHADSHRRVSVRLILLLGSVPFSVGHDLARCYCLPRVRLQIPVYIQLFGTSRCTDRQYLLMAYCKMTKWGKMTKLLTAMIPMWTCCVAFLCELLKYTCSVFLWLRYYKNSADEVVTSIFIEALR